MSKNEKPQQEEATKDQEIRQENDFWNPKRVRMLGASIIFMSFLLILGFGMVVYKLIEKSLVSQSSTVSQTAVDPSKMLIQNSSPSFEIDLKGYEINQMSISGKILTLHVKNGEKAQIWIIDTTAKKLKKIIQLNK